MTFKYSTSVDVHIGPAVSVPEYHCEHYADDFSVNIAHNEHVTVYLTGSHDDMVTWAHAIIREAIRGERSDVPGFYDRPTED